MDYIVRFHPEAEKEYSEAYRWYEEQLEGLGERFESAIERQINLIGNNPENYPKKKLNCRESKTEIFPYLIVYKFYPHEKLVFVVSVFHTSRKPTKKYRKRIL